MKQKHLSETAAVSTRPPRWWPPRSAAGRRSPSAAASTRASSATIPTSCRTAIVWCATIGKFANIAAATRINATNHPTWRPTLHHFTYRASDYWDDAEHETDFFDWRRANAVTIGHDTWLGHGATILPGVTVGDGAAIGSGAVVSKDVAPYTIVGGVPAKPIRDRFERGIAERYQALAWWDWDHARLRAALDDFRHLSAEAFLEKHGG